MSWQQGQGTSSGSNSPWVNGCSWSGSADCLDCLERCRRPEDSHARESRSRSRTRPWSLWQTQARARHVHERSASRRESRSRSSTRPRSRTETQARAWHDRSASRREHSCRPGPDAFFERACQPNLDEYSKTGAKAHPPEMTWKYHWDRDHERWHSKGMRVGPPGGGRNTTPGLHTRRNKVEKEKKKRKKEERALEDLLDPAGEAGRQAARDEIWLRDHKRCAARRNLD